MLRFQLIDVIRDVLHAAGDVGRLVGRGRENVVGGNNARASTARKSSASRSARRFRNASNAGSGCACGFSWDSAWDVGGFSGRRSSGTFGGRLCLSSYYRRMTRMLTRRGLLGGSAGILAGCATRRVSVTPASAVRKPARGDRGQRSRDPHHRGPAALPALGLRRARGEAGRQDAGPQLRPWRRGDHALLGHRAAGRRRGRRRAARANARSSAAAWWGSRPRA